MFNETRLMGRLTADPEIHHTDSNRKVATFSIACDRDYKGQDGKGLTDFFKCVAWRAKADFAEKHLRKGQLILVLGRFEQRPWTDRDGNKRTSFELVVSDFYFTGERKEPSNRPSAPPPTDEQSDFTEMTGNDDDLPF